MPRKKLKLLKEDSAGLAADQGRPGPSDADPAEHPGQCRQIHPGRGERSPSRRRPARKRILTVRIADTGVGIPKGEIPRLGERFYRADKTRSRELGGTGLGLSIVKHLMKAHRGRMIIDSTPGPRHDGLAPFSRLSGDCHDAEKDPRRR